MRHVTEIIAGLPEPLVEAAVRAALAEDLGLQGDITTNATVSATARAEAVIAARTDGVIAGLQLAEAAFRALDPNVQFEIVTQDATKATAGSVIARVNGQARAILTAERVALNYMGRLSGIATLTRRYVDTVAGTHVKIVDTRKTTPGLRAFEKYAVRCGGGQNHRTGLFDAILIKDNHIVAARGLSNAISAAQAAAGHMVKIEVEVDTLEQLDDVLKHKVDAILLDNMTPAQLKQAVKMIAGRAIAEASGGVSLSTVRAIAESGVDMISIGALTHSAPVLDLGLDFTTDLSAQ
ncbi:MAG: nicotinate-nucleotide diphosphorylase (carboxylating) [Hyphomicrobium sp.]|nr:MAG: nicotinate-nucleotide diphosphorylase (carboxylating) [Hyphomicrobium sp.]PPD01429.1 MAG: nicotinate-nucleotide diphosphorylase (carboxylating) [Hyphomicrobium sp.]